MPTVIVTGALRGIGRSVARMLYDQEYHLVAVYNSSHQLLNDFQIEFPTAECFRVDLSSRAEISRFIDQLADRQFQALINVAGVALGDAKNTFNQEQWDATMAINVEAPLLLSLGIAPQINPGGSIVNVSSLYGSLYGMDMSLSYGASKAALSNLTKSLSYQLRDAQIRVNAVAPSIVDTDMTAQDTPDMLAEVARRSGAGRIARPEEIASIISFLISNQASFINGQTIVADGGYSAWDGIY